MPRSGTSLMMQMLAAGGIPAVTDRRRAADPHNPRGYFEDERVKRLREDSTWIAEACGKAVKIIYKLLPHLPPRLDYRILFMERDLDEVYASQRDMLEARGDSAASQDRAIIRALSTELDAARAWLDGQSNIRWLAVPYAGLLNSPVIWAGKINEFLDGGLDESAMASAVDPALYRHR